MEATNYWGKPVKYSEATKQATAKEATAKARRHLGEIKRKGGSGHLVGKPYVWQSSQGSTMLQDYKFKQSPRHVERSVVSSALLHYHASTEEIAEYNRQVRCKIVDIGNKWYCEGHSTTTPENPGERCGAPGVSDVL